MGSMLSLLLLLPTAIATVVIFMRSNGTQITPPAYESAPDSGEDPVEPLAPSPSVLLTPMPSAPPPFTFAPFEPFPTAAPVTANPSIKPLPEWLQVGQDIVGDQGVFSAWSIALSDDGTTIVIGAWGAANLAGSTKVYRWDQDVWNQLGGDIDGENANDWSGWGITTSGDGNTVAIGSRANDGQDGALEGSGHVRVYQWSGTEWNQLGNDIDGEAPFEESGWSVSLSSDGLSVAIGAAGVAGIGLARVFRYDATDWIQVGSTIEGKNSGDNFGESLSLNSDGTIVAIGVPGSNESGQRSGHVEVYQLQSDDWVDYGPAILGLVDGGTTGHSVSLAGKGNAIAVGSPGVDVAGENAGQTRIYFWTGFIWFLAGSPIDGVAAGDESGASVSLSADGETVAIGSPKNDLNGENAGHTRIFRWLPDGQGKSWVQVADAIEGDSPQIISGRSVALSGDGRHVAVSAISGLADLGTNVGFARIYELN